MFSIHVHTNLNSQGLPRLNNVCITSGFPEAW